MTGHTRVAMTPAGTLAGILVVSIAFLWPLLAFGVPYIVSLIRFLAEWWMPILLAVSVRFASLQLWRVPFHFTVGTCMILYRLHTRLQELRIQPLQTFVGVITFAGTPAQRSEEAEAQQDGEAIAKATVGFALANPVS